jgi:hypothetical protein
MRRMQSSRALGFDREQGRRPNSVFWHPFGFSCAALLFLFLIGAAGQTKPSRAGEIRALVPTGHIVRTGVPELTAERNAPVYWQDLINTERGGRVRVGLLDGSVLNVGSESSLRILQHDPGAQQTQIELNYGRVRANAVRIARPGGKFEVRTPVAVAGVVGTGFSLFSAADLSLVYCFVNSVRVRNADENVHGEVILHAGEYTRVAKGMPPTPAAPALAEDLRKEEDETSIPSGPLEWSHAEISWPPAGCGEELTLRVRAWSKQTTDGREVETPVDPELLTGTLQLGSTTAAVEGGRATLPMAPGAQNPSGTFVPGGGHAPIPTKIWPSIPTAEGEGWRSPRAIFVGFAFYVLGPMGAAAQPEFTFGGHPATLLWSGACGAAFLSPTIPGGTYEVELTVGGRPTAQGVMNLVDVTYQLANPPSVKRGQETKFGVELHGLQGLGSLTQGRPVVITSLTNRTAMIIGDLRSNTPGASSNGETIIYRVSGQNIDASGTAKLDGSARGRQVGAFDLGVINNLDDALQLPKTPLRPVSPGK